MPYKNMKDRIENDKKRYKRNKEIIKRKNLNYYHKHRNRLRKRRLELAPQHRQKNNERERQRYADLRKEVLIAYGGGAKALYRCVKKLKFPKDRFQLLCANCNQGKRRNGGVCPHKKKNL